MGLRRVTALVVAGLLMVACSDGEADSSEAETPAVEETSPESTQEAAATTPTPEPPEVPEVVGDFPYDMSDGLPRELAELMYDQCQAEYVVIAWEERGADFDPYSVSDNGGRYQTHLEDSDDPLAIFFGSFTGDTTEYPWECRIWYDPDTGEWDSLDVKEYDETVAERPDDDAVETCETAVANKLVSPASAEFSRATFRDGDDGSWTVSGYVDSMNKLGVPLRSQWQCRVEFSTFLGSWYSTGVTVTER